jgi:hypothetical protein
MIENVECRRAVQVPLAGDGAIVRERPPVQLFLVHHLLEILGDGADDVNANQGEGLAIQL